MKKSIITTVRFSDEEFKNLKRKSSEAGITQTEFIRNAVSGKEIYVVSGFDDFTIQLKRIGNNLNQLTMLAHQRLICEVNLLETKDELRKLWRDINNLKKSLSR